MHTANRRWTSSSRVAHWPVHGLPFAGTEKSTAKSSTPRIAYNSKERLLFNLWTPPIWSPLRLCVHLTNSCVKRFTMQAPRMQCVFAARNTDRTDTGLNACAPSTQWLTRTTLSCTERSPPLSLVNTQAFSVLQPVTYGAPTIITNRMLQYQSAHRFSGSPFQHSLKLECTTWGLHTHLPPWTAIWPASPWPLA